MKDYDDVLSEGSFYLVNLSTRITQNASQKLAEVQGWLQTERQLSKVSKQEAIERAIIFYHSYILQEFEKQDQAQFAKQASNMKEESMPKRTRTRTYDVEVYREMTKYNGSGW